jgi:hypothetical protein
VVKSLGIWLRYFSSVLVKREKNDDDQHDDKPNSPFRNFKGGKNLTRDLHQQPCDHCVGDRYFVDMAPLPFSKECFRIHFARLGEALVTAALYRYVRNLKSACNLNNPSEGAPAFL